VIDVFRKPRFKIDLNQMCKRTGRVVRDCGCGSCREMKANVGV
jgi:hypothetical protein